MKNSPFRLTALAGLLAASVLASHAAQVVLVLHTGADSWQVLEAEKITINSKTKLRAGTAHSLQLDPAEYKKLPAEEILRMGILRRNAAGYLAHKDGADWVPAIPDGANFKTATPCVALWSSAAIAIQPDRSAKNMTPVKPADLFAILPAAGREEAVVSFLADPANFHGLGAKDENAAFEERMSLLVAAAGFVTGPSAAALQHLVLSEMQTSLQRLNSGIAHYSDLDHGLLYVSVSQKAWPNDASQQKARQALLDQKAWVARRIAILKAFNSGRLWDAFLDKYSDFARFDNSFDDVRKLRAKALAASYEQHFSEGKRLYESKQPEKYPLALRELKLAQLRNPNDQVRTLIEAVGARDERAGKRPPPLDMKNPDHARIVRHLSAAKNYIKQGNRWEEAENEIQSAAAIDERCYAVLITRALLLEAQGKLPEALKVLDDYAKVAPDEGVEAGEDLRGTITSELASQRRTLKDAIAKAESEGDYARAQQSAQSGVALDPSDLYFLLHAGLNNAITRRRDDAQQQLSTYLRLSQSSAGDAQELAKVYSYLEVLKTAPPDPAGVPNWYSGYKSPPGLFYCPVSLMPNAQPADIKASRKEGASFQWAADGSLTTVTTRSQEAGEKSVSIYFDYYKDHRAVRRVAVEPFTATGTQGSAVMLLNHPVIDPLMVERLMGKHVATIVAGNPYFQPFVWKGIYRFSAEYDEQGRVKSASLLDSPEGPRILDFQWDGARLTAIVERGGQGYRRNMAYAGDRLESESISFRGKTARIKYTYKGDRLAEAECSDDPSLDNRSRHVTFR